MSSRVFVVQQSLKRNSEGFMVPKFDLTEAGKFGEVQNILPHGMSATCEGDSICDRLKANLKTYTDDDYILPVGNPTLIGWAIFYAATYNDGLVKTLMWNGRKNCYEVIEQVLR